MWLRDWRTLREQIAYVLDYAEPEGALVERLRRMAVLAVKGPATRRLHGPSRAAAIVKQRRGSWFDPVVADAFLSFSFSSDSSFWDACSAPNLEESVTAAEPEGREVTADRNLSGTQLSKPARILATADQLDALSAERPDRGKLPREKVIAILREEAGKGLCVECGEAAEKVLESDGHAPN